MGAGTLSAFAFLLLTTFVYSQGKFWFEIINLKPFDKILECLIWKQLILIETN